MSALEIYVRFRIRRRDHPANQPAGGVLEPQGICDVEFFQSSPVHRTPYFPKFFTRYSTTFRNSSSVPSAPFSTIAVISSSQPARLMRIFEKTAVPWQFVQIRATISFPSPSGSGGPAALN